MDKRSHAYQWRAFPHLNSSDTKLHLGSSFNPESPSLPVLLNFSLTGSVAVHAVHLEVIFAVAFDQRSRDESHEGDGQELCQCAPGEDVVQRGDLGEYGARTNADEVVGNQT